MNGSVFLCIAMLFGLSLQAQVFNDYAQDILILDDGKILLLGSSGQENRHNIALARYLPDGTPDPDFGNMGRIKIDNDDSDDVVWDACFGEDGRILLAGETTRNLKKRMMVAAFNEDGRPDTSFGDKGFARIEWPFQNSSANAVCSAADGSIYLAGSVGTHPHSEMAVAKLKPDGSIDSSFQSDGRLSFKVHPYYNLLYDIKTCEEGSIFLAGESRKQSQPNFYPEALLIKLNTNGMRDPSFGNRGIVYFSAGLETYNAFSCLEWKNDRELLAGGFTESDFDSDLLMACYNTDGELIKHFGDQGVLKLDLGTPSDFLNYFLVKTNGDILAAGSRGERNQKDFALLAFDKDGQRLFEFAEEGYFQQDILRRYDALSAVAETSDGSYLAAGFSYKLRDVDFALIRLDAYGRVDTTFGNRGIVHTDFGILTKEKPKSISSLNGTIEAGKLQQQFRMEYVLEKRELVSLFLYNAEGEQIKIYRENQWQDAGRYVEEVSFPSDLSSGTYWLVLTTTASHLSKSFDINP